MLPNEEQDVWISDNSLNDSAYTILRIVKEEADRLGAVVNVEEQEEKNISNKVRVSLKMNGKVFRLTLSWVRDECMDRGFAGHGYIQTKGPPFPPERILDAPLLRQLIREKLGVLPPT